jgi:hypothetical protein
MGFFIFQRLNSGLGLKRLFKAECTEEERPIECFGMKFVINLPD